ncbi:MAG: hypothetical protein ACI9LY_003976 [Arenicella sp.]|jgi:hypothetical protein
MANELPYLPSYKNVGLLFEKIKTAKIPETFTQKFLYETIGIKGAGDRPLISLLKNLKFLDSSGKPTSRYSTLKNSKISGVEVARGLREAYKPLFDANESAHTLAHNDLKGLVAQVSGADTNTTSKIVGTFKAILALADFESEEQLDDAESPDENAESPRQPVDVAINVGKKGKGLRPEFHYNIQVHLPSNGTEETYMNIFNAIRKVFE